MCVDNRLLYLVYGEKQWGKKMKEKKQWET